MSQAERMLTTEVSKKDSMVVAILDVDNFKVIDDAYVDSPFVNNKIHP
jgi:GGDEF domain-containing protein